ncbi:hypothetical protein BU17DRAFT_46135 [Hysterangium stoloniferum]|nr:hypothetical protein BU17DRAFT_46135 [Hysterangium stoloniferum]
MLYREQHYADNDIFPRDLDDVETRGRSTPRWTPNSGRRDTRFRSFPSTSTWSSELSTNVNSQRPKARAVLRRFWDFILQNDHIVPEDFIPNYRWLPILSAVTIPFSILLQIPGCTEHWYVRTLDNETVQSRPNPPILLAANVFAMMVALIANLCLIVRFLEKRVKQMTIIAICLLGLHDVVNAVTVTIFGVEHRFDDGFTYGQPFWLVVASTVVSLFTTVTLIWDLWATPEFSKSGTGLTQKQRSLVVIVIILLCWITLGGLVNSVLLHLTYINGLYFTVVSIETIGFGDIHPDSTSSRIFIIIYTSIGILNIGLAISTARETIIESFELSYRRRVSEVAAKRAEYKKLKETQRIRKHAIERMLNNAGLPAYVTDPLRPTKLRLNEEALSPAQLSAAKNGTRTPGPTFERTRTFSLESSATDLYPNAQFSEENYKNFKMGIVREERREFAAKPRSRSEVFKDFQKRDAVNLHTDDAAGGLEHEASRPTLIDGRRDTRFKSFPSTSTWSSELSTNVSSQLPKARAVLRRFLGAGLPAYVIDPLRPTKLRLNEEALSPAQLSAAENEALHIANRRTNRNWFSGDGTRTPGPMFERTFSLESGAVDLYPNGQFSEENYKKFKVGIVREERREFAAKLTVACSIFLAFWLIGAGIFSQTEKWDYGIALYFCFVAFSAIGYGDFSPATPAGRSVFVVWALLGVGALTILISVLLEACSSRYKNALSRGSFARAVKNFRSRRATSSSPHFSPSRMAPRSYSRDVSPDDQYTAEQARRDLEGLPNELLNHAKGFHEHIYYFLSSMNSSEPPPPTLEKMLHEIADSEHMDEGLKLEILGDDGARKANPTFVPFTILLIT